MFDAVLCKQAWCGRLTLSPVRGPPNPFSSPNARPPASPATARKPQPQRPGRKSQHQIPARTLLCTPGWNILFSNSPSKLTAEPDPSYPQSSPQVPAHPPPRPALPKPIPLADPLSRDLPVATLLDRDSGSLARSRFFRMRRASASSVRSSREPKAPRATKKLPGCQQVHPSHQRMNHYRTHSQVPRSLRVGPRIGLCIVATLHCFVLMHSAVSPDSLL